MDGSMDDPRELDLNKLRQMVLQSQKAGTPLPPAPKDQIVAYSDGTLGTGDETGSSRRAFSVVHQGPYATPD